LTANGLGRRICEAGSLFCRERYRSVYRCHQSFRQLSAVEQVVASGTPVPLPVAREGMAGLERGDAVVVSGENGTVLADRLRAAGVAVDGFDREP
jgi:hypothetical protein